MSDFIYEHIVQVDLAKPLFRKNYGLIMASGDEKANRFGAQLTRNGENVDASGCSVMGYLIRPNNETLRISGTADGSTVYVDVTDNGYVYDGEFTLTIKVYGDGFETAVAIFDGQIAKTTTETIVDGDRVLYGVDDILAQIEAMETAEANANAAASRAEQAATDANAATDKANTAADDATNAANAANDASELANAAAEKADEATANADTATLNANSASDACGAATEYAISKGADAMKAAEEANDAADAANAAAESVSSAKLEAMRATNNADSAAERANDAAAICEGMNPYPVGSIYLSVNDTDPANLFGGTWERIQDTFLLAAGSTYTAGETGGEATHQLTTDELPYVNMGEVVWAVSKTTTSVAAGTDVSVITDVKSTDIQMSFGRISSEHNNMPPYLAVYVWKRVS